MIKWILFFFFPIWAYAQHPTPFLTTFSSQHGLPPLKVFKMAKDSSGYLWLGSNLGLHRFDGKTFRTFNNLPNSAIPDIQVRPDGKVFVAIQDFGLGVYNEFTGEFDLYDEPTFFQNLNGLDFNISFGKDQRVFTSFSGYGLVEFDEEEKEFRSILKKPFIKDMFVLASDPNQIVLAGDSIFIYDLSRNKITYSFNYYPFSIDQDEEGNIWFNETTRFGLCKLNVHSKQEIWYDDGKERFNNILLYEDGVIWTDAKNEIVKFDIEEEEYEYLNLGTSDISGIFMEKNGRFWFGQDNKLNVIDPQNQFFQQISGTENFNYASAEKLTNNQYGLLSFFTGELHYSYLDGTEIQVADKFNKEKELEYPFSMVKIGGELFVAFSNGIARYGIQDQEFEKVNFQQFNSFFTKNNKIRLLKDDRSNLYISPLADPILFRVNVKTLAIDSIHYITSSLPFEHSLNVTPAGLIEIPTVNGIVTIDFDTREQKEFPFFLNSKETSLGYIDDFLWEGSDIWIIANNLTYQGVFEKGGIYVSEEMRSREVYNYSDNMDIIKGLHDSRIILTSAGIKVFKSKEKKFDFWGIDEGLTNVDRRTNIKQLGQDLFILSRGAYFVDQEKLFASPKAPKVFISSFKVNETKVNDDILKPKQNDIKIKFESIDLTKPLDVKYKYRLSPENPWINVGYQGNEVYFLDLKPGEYHFEVCAKQKYTGWSSPVFRRFEISSPFWKKWWFVSGAILISFLLIYLYYKYQLAKAAEVSRMKSRMVSLENEALRAQMNPHFIFNSLNSIKSYIIDHSKEDAADYLTDFSDLIRLILANSREEFIPIEKEITALKLYMDIENIRLEQKFTYQINNEVSDTLIQPLTLQPFIENAIWHGFIHKKGHGLLEIDILKENEKVVITIQDDGVGRRRSQVIEQKHSRKRSFGILITKERLSRSEIENNIKIEDLTDEDGKGIGTKVSVIIPYQKTK